MKYIWKILYHMYVLKGFRFILGISIPHLDDIDLTTFPYAFG